MNKKKDGVLSQIRDLKRRLQLLFVEDFLLDENPYLAFRQLLLAAFMLVIAGVLFIFILVHSFITGNFNNVIINTVGLLWLAGLLIRLHRTKQLGHTGHYITVAIIVFFQFFAHINQNQEFSLIWVFFVPFVVIASVGRKAGTAYLMLFFSMMIYQSYTGLGVWDSETWSILSFSRFIGALFLGYVLALVMDMAITELNERIQQQREIEADYAQELKRLTTIDSLTEVYNRRYLNEVVADRIRALARTDSYLAFFIIDIDYFKLYNDSYGHLEGDQVLIKVAKCIKQYIKRYDDLVFRLGGEEFGGVITTDQPDETVKWLAGLVPEVEGLKLVHSPEAELPYVTISVGVYFCPANQVRSISELYRASDKALYKAKNLGRNRAVICGLGDCKEAKS